MDVTPSFVVATAENIHIRLRYDDPAAVTSVHVTHTSRQGRHQSNPQHNPDSINRTIRFVHANFPFAEKIQIWYAAVTDSRSVSSRFSLIFIHRK
jgi:hypothetical protein